MTALGLAAFGVVLAAFLLWGDSVEREAAALENAWARASEQAACTAAQLPEGTQIYPPPEQPGSGCIGEPGAAEVAAAQPGGAAPAAFRPVATVPAAGPTAGAGRTARPASNPPTYIRLRKPEPRPESPQLALESLRGTI